MYWMNRAWQPWLMKPYMDWPSIDKPLVNSWFLVQQDLKIHFFEVQTLQMVSNSSCTVFKLVHWFLGTQKMRPHCMHNTFATSQPNNHCATLLWFETLLAPIRFKLKFLSEKVWQQTGRNFGFLLARLARHAIVGCFNINTSKHMAQLATTYLYITMASTPTRSFNLQTLF